MLSKGRCARRSACSSRTRMLSARSVYFCGTNYMVHLFSGINLLGAEICYSEKGVHDARNGHHSSRHASGRSIDRARAHGTRPVHLFISTLSSREVRDPNVYEPHHRSLIFPFILVVLINSCSVGGYIVRCKARPPPFRPAIAIFDGTFPTVSP